MNTMETTSTSSPQIQSIELPKLMIHKWSEHECRLDPLDREHELPRMPPYAPALNKCLNNFLIDWMTACWSHPKCRKYLRSTFDLYQEKRRQLIHKDYRMIIHPLSRMVIVHHTFSMIIWLAVFILDPLLATFLSPSLDRNSYNPQLELAQLTLNMCAFIMIFVNFFEGYIPPRSTTMILDQWRIVRRYLMGYFFFDALPLMYDVACYLVHQHFVIKGADMLHLYMLRFVRIVPMLDYFGELMAFFGVNENVIKSMRICLSQLVFVHWWTCLFLLLPNMCHYLGFSTEGSFVVNVTMNSNVTLHNLYVQCLQCVSCHYFGAGVGVVFTRHPSEMVTLIGSIICGYVVNIYFAANILLLFGTLKVAETKYDQFMHQLKEYGATKKFPVKLRERLRNYYDYRFQKQFFNEQVILNALSEHLRLEVLLYSTSHLINRVPLLREAPEEAIGALLVQLHQEIYLPGDYIYKAGGYNDYVCFISYGTLAAYDDNTGQEVVHLEDGHYFGEMTVVIQEQLPVNVVAVEITEIFYMKNYEFWELIQPYHLLQERMTQNAVLKHKLFHKIMSDREESSIDPNNIILQLRKGRILEKGIRRRPSHNF